MEPKPILKLPKKLFQAMPKRAPLDLDQFKIDLPKPVRDPLDTLIPTAPIASVPVNEKPTPGDKPQPEMATIKPAPIGQGTSLKKGRKQSSKLSRYHAIKQAGYHDSTVERLRKALKFAGKDPFFGRFTPEEKGVLADVAHAYKRKGVKTSENEIARIAVNFLMHDYEENGEDSLLERVLKALNT
jgi:hypothetical protein